MLSRRLLLSYIFLTLVCTLATGLFVRAGVRASREEDERRTLIAAAESIDRAVAAKRAAGDLEGLQDVVRQMGRTSLCRVTVVDVSGEVLAETERDPSSVGNHLERPEIRATAPGRPGWSVRKSSTTGKEYLYVARLTDDGRAYVRVATPLDRLAEQLDHVNDVLLKGLVVELAFAALLGRLVASRLTRRIDRQLAVARRVADGDLSARVDAVGRDELDELGRATNRVAERLEAQIVELTAKRKEIVDVLDSTADGLAAINADDVVTHLNPEAVRLFEAPADAVGRPYWETIRDAVLPDLVAEVRRTLRPVEAECASAGASTRLDLEARVSPIHDADGGYAGAVLAFRDVTRLKRLESVRRDFVANVSHEMKTPLTSILGSIETLLAGARDDPEAAQEFLAKIDRNARSLAALVSDLLELSRIESGGVRMAAEPVRVAAVVAEAVAAVAEKARDKGLDLATRDDLPGAEVRGDPPLLVRALVNLLENAVAYTPKGGRVRVVVRGAEGRVEVSVEDTGVGIPAGELERIFERFYRVDKARSRALGGTGLGLAIVRHVAERHGGAVRVTSEVGRGSTFTLSLPPASATEPGSRAAS